MTEQLDAAFVRGILISFITAGVTFFATYATTSDSHTLIAGTGGAFFTALALRFGGEGLYDSVRQASGDVRPADVGQPKP